MISVIVPIYKVQPYLRRCLDSIIGQTYQDLEIILVDDGSPDRCGEICEEYARKDTRIHVYHKTNGGLSDARNYGVERSHGEYITFIDSDDYVSPDYIEYLYILLQKNKADISVCCLEKTSQDTIPFSQRETMSAEVLLSGYQACKQLFGELYPVLVTAWGKLYAAGIVKQYPFPVGRIHEDEATTCKYYFDSKKVVVGHRCLYAYYSNPNGITSTKSITAIIWAKEHRAQFFESRNAVELSELAWAQVFFLLWENPDANDGECANQLRFFCDNKHVSNRIRFEASFYSFSPWGYKKYKQLRASCKKIFHKKRNDLLYA